MVRPKTAVPCCWSVLLTFAFGPAVLSAGPRRHALAIGTDDSTVLRAVALAQEPQDFRASVDLVTIDVQVVAAGSTPISTLTTGQFEVRIAKHDRPVILAQFLHADEGAVTRPATPPRIDSGTRAMCVFGFERVSTGATAHYLLGVEPTASDKDGVKHPEITVTHKALSVRRWAWRSRVAPAATSGRVPPSWVTRAEQEAFLSKGQIVASGQRPTGAAGRVSVEDGPQKHDAAVETADGTDPTTRNYRFNIAAYELDKALGLGLVPPSVARVVDGHPVSLTWWIDDFAMSEQDRRRQKVEPPDLEQWNRQIQAVRVFDELISNAYRDVSPPLYLNSVWDNLLITRDWSVWIIDHTGAFRVRRRLEYPETLTRCDRAVLGKLRQLTRGRLKQVVGTYLSAEQLDALEIRRRLLVKHFDEQISKKGEAAVVYDLPTR
jgi:hypothetical protein